MIRSRIALAACCLLTAALARAQEPADNHTGYLRDAQALYQSGQYFKSARYAFAAHEQNQSLRPEAYSWITLSLTRAGLYNAASYFFIRTLQTGNKAAIQRVLGETENLLVRVGGDILRKYLIRHTRYEDYDLRNRSAYLYSLGKDTLLSGKEEKAIGYLNGIQAGSPLWPVALQLRGSANAILGRNDLAIRDFRECQSRSADLGSRILRDPRASRQLSRESDDLHARCVAGEARTLYQMERFDDADQVYDGIPKSSFVWPDILFEQAWNSFGRREYNRTLGRLVSYKSPALGFVFNTEVDVLRAQSFLALCLYQDANQVINEFNEKYTRVGEEVKRFVEMNSNNLKTFHELGKNALSRSLYTKNDFHRLANRFVRSPYFQNLVAAERDVGGELNAVRQFDHMQPGVSHEPGKGFPGFLEQVLGWRLKSIQLLGGAFVKNSLIDYHSALIADFEKMAFIKLEMLRQAKDKLIYKNSQLARGDDRGRGNMRPSRRDYQYYWSFNGEFWNDELGDYVFGLESECQNGGS
ncbi:MAG TPA: hypothetical protein VJB59_05935 [Bdellovibrionota bacterium]|nr:hypothetical protein [Bdellovibrionota bacterium]